MRSTVYRLSVILGFVVSILYSPSAHGQLPVTVEAFAQPFHIAYTAQDGLPEESISQITLGPEGRPHARTASGDAFVFDGNRWSETTSENRLFDPNPWYPSLASFVGSAQNVRDVAQRDWRDRRCGRERTLPRRWKRVGVGAAHGPCGAVGANRCPRGDLRQRWPPLVCVAARRGVPGGFGLVASVHGR